MQRQSYAYSLPSQDDSSLFFISDNTSILSSSSSYLENIWPQIASPEPDTLIPYYVYQYPCFQIPFKPVFDLPSFFDPPLTPDTFNVSDDLHLYNDDLSKMYNCTNDEFNCNINYGDGIDTENLSSYVDTPLGESFNYIQDERAKPFPIITSRGALTILLRHLIRVDISPSGGMHVTNPPAACIAAINGTGHKSCVIHPNGRVLHISKDIHMVTFDCKAKICKRGIIFTSAKRCLSYLVDDSGTKTASENFRNLNHDFSLDVFFRDDVRKRNFEECYKMENETIYKSYKNGDEVWRIGGFRIKQDQRGDVQITRNGGQYAIRTSPTTGQVSVKTSLVEISIGRYGNKYFDVRTGDKQVTASLKGFRVQNGTQKAGFNSSGKVVLL